MCLRFVEELSNRRVEHSTEKQRRIMAAGTPSGRLHADDVLHVLDTFAIPLIIERRKPVGRTAPLFVNVRMATLARLRIHEELRWNTAAVACLYRTWKKLAIHAIA